MSNKKNTSANSIVHRANTRNSADFGWLKVNHTFSFANYYNPERMNFGALRVLNDDIIAAGKGFDTHPHKNMEIITIPLEGKLRHKDDMGNEGIISRIIKYLLAHLEGISKNRRFSYLLGIRHKSNQYLLSSLDQLVLGVKKASIKR